MSRKTPMTRDTATPGSHRLVTTSVALAGIVALAGAVVWMYAADAPIRGVSAKAASVSAPTAPAAQAAPQAPAKMADTTLTPAPAPAPTAAAAQARASAPATPTQAEAAGLPAGSAAQQAFIDPKTGKLRPVEHDDVAALRAAAPAKRLARTAAVEPQEKFGPEGAVGVDVPEDLQTYTVATRQPDGSVAIGHVSGPKAAVKQLRGAQAKKTAAHDHDKEERNDR